MNDFLTRYNNYKSIIEASLETYFSKDLPMINLLRESMSYSVLNGGKRIRGVLCLASNEMLGGEATSALPFSCGIEMIHAYSLIHDDLPCMDDDVLRRGVPCNHIKFGEGNAVLAGDGLLNYAYEIMLKSTLSNNNLENKIKALDIVASGAGVFGMIAGQSLDIESEGKAINFSTLQSIHKNKTGALITASVCCGGLLASCSENEFLALKTYGENIGVAFQITDDVLDVCGDEKDIGKSIGKDELNDKLTYVKIFGVEKSITLANDHILKAKDALNSINGNTEFLKQIADQIISRKN